MPIRALKVTSKPTETDAVRERIAIGLRTLKQGQALSPTTTGSISLLQDDRLYFAEFGPGTDIDDLPIDNVEAAGRGAALKAFRVETFAIHAAVQRARPQARAILILRAPRLASWGLAGRTLPIRSGQLLRPNAGEEVPLAHVSPSFVQERLAGNPDAPALLLPDGRAVVWGVDVADVAQQVLRLEETALVERLAERLRVAKAGHGSRGADNVEPTTEVALAAAPSSHAREGAALSFFAIQAKRQADAAVAQLVAAGSLSVLRDGTAALRVPGQNRFVISGFESPLIDGPSGTALVGHDGTVHEGTLHERHDDVLPLYRAIFEERPDALVAVHVRSPYLVAWALARRPLPLATFPDLSGLGIAEIPVTDLAPATDDAPIRDTLRWFPKSPALLHANRGLVTWGGDLQSAARLISALEETAKLVLEAEGLATGR